MGLVGFEPTTPALSRRCSNRLSYRPAKPFSRISSHRSSSYITTTDKRGHLTRALKLLKEVIQPHLPIRLPCYDFTPVMNPTVVIAPLRLG